MFFVSFYTNITLLRKKQVIARVCNFGGIKPKACMLHIQRAIYIIGKQTAGAQALRHAQIFSRCVLRNGV